MIKVAAVVLAAGTSSRFNQGPTKLVASFNGKPLVRHAVDAATGSRAFRTVVVTGHACGDVRRALCGADVVFVHNERYASGIASSLGAGLRALSPDVEGAVISLGDMPKVTSSLIDLLIRTFARHRGSDAVLPVFDGRHGNPALISQRLFSRAIALSGDEGARRLLNGPDVRLVQLPVAGRASVLDVDTWDDLQELSRLSPRSPSVGDAPLGCSRKPCRSPTQTS